MQPDPRTSPGTASHDPALLGVGVDVRGMTKRFGTVVAVDDLSFQAHPGRVTGFLGPNGSGKTTTLRCILGLVRPTSGTATVGGSAVRQMPQPARVVGAALEASGFHPGRTARDHLRILTAASGLPASRSQEVLDIVGLASAADRRVGGFSLGMRQRLTLACALLGDPRVLILDEPANGLDPEGIAWLRTLLRALAAEGRTVLVSSHALGEIQQTADDVVIIAAGRLRYAGPIAGLCGLVDRDGPSTDGLSTDGLSTDGLSTDGLSTSMMRNPPVPSTFVRSPDATALAAAIEAAHPGAQVRRTEDSALLVTLPAPAIGAIACRIGVELHELRSPTPVAGDVEGPGEDESGRLELAFLRLTSQPDDRPASERAEGTA